MAFRLFGGSISVSSEMSTRDARALLDGAGCAICRRGEASERRWFGRYQDETRTDLAMRQRVRRAHGFCSGHTRQLLDLGAASSWLARWVFCEVAEAGRAALGSGAAPAEPCPACVAAETVTTEQARLLARALPVQEVTEAYQASDGLCLPHAGAVLGLATPAVGRLIAGGLADRLEERSAGRLEELTTLTGRQPDATRRRAAPDVDPAVTALSRPDDGGCPFCVVRARTERGYLAWLAGGSARDDGAPDRREAVLCAVHLADLPSGAERAGAIVRENAEVRAGQLRGYLDRVASASTRAARRAGARTGADERCHLCGLVRDAVAREAGQLALLADDPGHAGLIAEAHGVCLRHGLSGFGGLAEPWQRVLVGRIGLLAYELGESERKSGWDARWEPKGAEMRAWQWAPKMLDGAVLLGTTHRLSA